MFFPFFVSFFLILVGGIRTWGGVELKRRKRKKEEKRRRRDKKF